MIVDMIRNDMSTVADLGTVRVPSLFSVERYPTVLQMTSTITAQSDAPTSEIVAALFPCASITGAPKVRTMEIIAELETEPRGIYTGCIGFISPRRQVQFNVAIRTVSIDKANGIAEYGVGGGIVWDSNRAEEYRECQLKAHILTERQPNFDLLETILWEPESGYFLLQEHLQRLANSAEYFGIPIDRTQVWDTLKKLCLTFDHLSYRVRLLIAQDGTISTEAIPLDRVSIRQPQRIALAARPIDSGNPFLYHKTTNRQVYEAADAVQADCDDVLLWNERGEITESRITNVVVQFGQELVTPPIQCGLLAGTHRAHLLAQSVIQERVITVDEIKGSDKIYLINSVRKWIDAKLVN
jgi:para-aminobenzoate synthetase/4-amino-4-deoxychorismate lyase